MKRQEKVPAFVADAIPRENEPEEPLAPQDGKWHAVQRRFGNWFVERTYDTEDGAVAYQQLGGIARDLFDSRREDSLVLCWSDEDVAEVFAKLMNGNLGEESAECLMDFLDAEDSE